MVLRGELTKPTTMAATYLNYAAELIIKANDSEGKEQIGFLRSPPSGDRPLNESSRKQQQDKRAGTSNTKSRSPRPIFGGTAGLLRSPRHLI